MLVLKIVPYGLDCFPIETEFSHSHAMEIGERIATFKTVDVDFPGSKDPEHDFRLLLHVLEEKPAVRFSWKRGEKSTER